jgi:hypothetical protein
MLKLRSPRSHSSPLLTSNFRVLATARLYRITWRERCRITTRAQDYTAELPRSLLSVHVLRSWLDGSA